MAGMLEKVFTKSSPKDKQKSRNLLKRLGIVSGVIWVAAMGAVYALKEMQLSPANTHDKAGHGEETAEAGVLSHVPSAAPEADQESSHDAKTESHDASSETHGEKAEAHGDKNHAHGEKDHAHGEKAQHHDGKAVAHGEKDHAHGEKAEPHGGKDEGHGEKAAPAGAETAMTGPATEDERKAFRELAEIHASQGNLEKALYPLRKLMQEPTQDVALLSLATEVFLGTGNYQEALTAARKALRHAAPGRIDLRVAIILSQYRLGQVNQAFKTAEAALKEHPKDLDLLTTLGTMEIEMGPAHPQYGDALTKALKIKPGHVPALYQMGRKAQLEGDYKDAETLFRKVLKKEPKHAKAHGQLGTALYHLRKDRDAAKEFKAALALNRKDYNTWFNLGELNLSQAAREKSPRRIRQLRAEAMAAYLKAVEWNPSHAEAHFRIGVILNGNGQFKEAIRHLEASRKIDVHHVPTLLQLAVAYENLKHPDRAKACLEQALKLDPMDKIVQFKLKQMT